jgi:molecular chaperone GrpE (heat shock protein)
MAVFRSLTMPRHELEVSVVDAHEGLGSDNSLGLTDRTDVGQEVDATLAATVPAIGQPEAGSPGEGQSSTVAAAPPDSGTTAALIDVAIAVQDLAAKQEALRELFEARIRSDEVQGKALERLHDQVQEYKTNFVRQEMLPLLRDLIYCYDFAADEVERAQPAPAGPGSNETAQAFDHLRQMIADVLGKYDVVPYRSAGPEFDRREQQCVRTVPTNVALEEKKIAVVGAIGFRLADLIIRKEQVTVFKYSPADGGKAAQRSEVRA